METKNLTFVLNKGEKIIEEYNYCTYAGVAYVTLGSGFGGASGNTGLGAGLFTSKQTKREGSIFDAKRAHIYLTNKRIVFCSVKVSFWDGEEKEIGTPFAEILPNQIKGMNKSSKLANPAIDIAIPGQNGGIDNIKFWFVGGTDDKEVKRDKLFASIKKLAKI